MGLFDKFFSRKQIADQSQEPKGNETVHLQKGDLVISTGDHYGFKIIRPLIEEQRAGIKKSTLLLRTGQLYTHYWTDNLDGNDRNNPEWQNMVMFFWKADEPFPNKSLPPEFETFKVKCFLFSGDVSNISLQSAPATPWFGMPGLGQKHVCAMNGQKISIPELNELGLIEYIQPVELTNGNLAILTNREEYFFLIDEKITPFENGRFHLKGKPIAIDLAYSIGGINIIKIIV